MSEEELHSIQEVLTKDIENIKSTMDASHEMMCLSKNDEVVYVNKNYLTFVGNEQKDNLGAGRFSRIHKDDIEEVTEVIQRFYKTHKPYRVTYRLLEAQGSYKWIVEDGRLFFDANGAALGSVCKCVNIDTEKQMEIKLHVAETKYRRLFETAHDGILILDSQTGEITDVNPFLQELLGYTKAQFLGKKLWEVGAFKNIKASKDAFKVLQQAGYIRYDDLPLETLDGRLIPVEFVSNSYFAGSNKVIQCNIRDISIRKRAEIADKALVTLTQEQQKNAFIADVTHELRTPLAIIKGNVELSLRDKELRRENVEEVLKAINVEVVHLAGMFSDLAMLTTENKNNQSVVPFRLVRIDTLLDRVMKRLCVVADERKIKITVTANKPVSVYGDTKYLEKLFSNLISNAIYYGKKNGFVKIECIATKSNITILVTDNGIGIDEKDLPQIFGRFYRSTSAREVNQEGTGLGLAISKWIVEAHKGTISVISSPLSGTTFSVILPIGITE